jgi:hypothetical protein
VVLELVLDVVDPPAPPDPPTPDDCDESHAAKNPSALSPTRNPVLRMETPRRPFVAPRRAAFITSRARAAAGGLCPHPAAS